MNYYLLTLNISTYQGPDYILAICSDESCAQHLATDKALLETSTFNIQPTGIEIQCIHADVVLGKIAYVVSKYVEGFGQTVRESLNLFSDQQTAQLNMKKWQQASEADPDLSFPEYFLLEQIPLNQLRQFNEKIWQAGDYGEYD